MKTQEELLDNFYTKCKQARLSITPQRLAIYKALIGMKNHPSPDTIYQKIKTEFPMISFATVYKTLETFEQNKIINKVTQLHQTLRYDPFLEPHHHMVCTKCKKIIDLDREAIEELQIPKEIFKDNIFVNYNIHLNIICKECQ